MTMAVKAVYSNGMLKLVAPLPLKDNQEVHVFIDPINPSKLPERLTLEEFEAALDEMAEIVPADTPPLPPDFSRDDCYGDRG